MPELINDKKIFSLLEVTLSIQKTITERYTTPFWVKAEMNKLNHYSHSGHCYPELLEKKDGKVVAQISSILWKSDYVRINDLFLQMLQEPLKDGITILFSATISYTPAYGLSLRIIDIDPGFSLGELEKEKRETIDRLRKEGLFTSNKELPLALLPQRIAVISVETSKGYSDYLNIIAGNPWGYTFFNFLFPALLQGDRSIESILFQLRQIKKVVHHFDIVTIIRGGGGDVGLSSYNNYELAKEIATFPIPVLTGIGHSTNETVTEMVAYRNAITPTELADFLLQKFHNFAVPVQKAQERIVDMAKRMIADEKLGLYNALKYFRSVTINTLGSNRNEIRAHAKAITQHAVFLLRSEKQHLAAMERNINSMDPANVLRRGFTITLQNGKAVRSSKEVKAGETLSTMTAEGTIISQVKETQPPTQP